MMKKVNIKEKFQLFDAYWTPKILGEGQKPADEPQKDKGICIFNNDGSFSITWGHWDGAKEIREYFFETENAYISIDDQNIFHTVFMKESIKKEII